MEALGTRAWQFKISLMQNFTEKDLFQHISVDTEPMCGEVDAILLIVGAVITNINNNK